MTLAVALPRTTSMALDEPLVSVSAKPLALRRITLATLLTVAPLRVSVPAAAVELLLIVRARVRVESTWIAPIESKDC